jgi:rhamnogalacturonan acetylesterase
MKLLSVSVVLALGALEAIATPTRPDLAPRATPTVYLCGDSTMAKNGANDGATDGWGQYLGTYSTVSVVNKAIGGRSARSYWDEGRFTAVADVVKSGDIVVIEFGHNDGGSPESNDNGRSDCPGTGTQTCISDVTGNTVYTFVFYVVQAAKLMTAKGATVVLSSQTPNNLWETGVFVNAPPRFVGYQLTAQKALGTGVTFVDHYQAVSNSK